MYLRYCKQRYLKFYRLFNRFAMKCFYYWVPGSKREDVKILLYADRVKIYQQQTCLAEYWPGPLPGNPWHESIGTAAYDSHRREILIESKGSLWRGPADFSGVFAKDPARIPVGAMGTNVMQAKGDELLVGSFGGRYQCRMDGGQPIDVHTGKPSPAGRSRGPRGGWQVAGYFEAPAGERFVATHDDGLIGIGDASSGGRFQMPNEMIVGYRMPLWNFRFETHNGRIVRDWLGGSYFLVSLLGAVSQLASSIFAGRLVIW